MKFYLSSTLLLLAAVAGMAEEMLVILDGEVTESTPKSLSCGSVNSLGENDTLIWKYTNSSGESTTDFSNLIYNITDDTKTGIYACFVNNNEKASYLAAKLSQPEILNARKSVIYNDGDVNRKLTCKTDGSYPDPEFMWLKRGEMEGELPILVTPETNPNYDIQTNGTESVLKFHNVTYSEAKTFICQVKNVAGNGTVEILVRVKDKYAAVWPFLGIVIEVVILIVIIFMYERHNKKADLKNDQVDVAEDQKPLNRDEGMQIRNRNGNNEVKS